MGDMLPAGWTSAKLETVIRFKYGKALPKHEREAGEFPVYGSGGIIGWNAVSLTSGPTLIIGRKGTFGEVWLSERPCWPIDTTYYVDQLFEQPIAFWYRYLRYLPLKDMNRSTAVPGLRREDAHSLSVFVPPLAEQKRIANKFESLFATTDAAEKTVRAALELINVYRRSVLKSAYLGFLTQAWRLKQKRLQAQTPQVDLKATASELSSKAIQSDPASLPSSWKWCRIDEVGEVKLGRQRSPKYHSGERMHPYLRVANVFEDRIDISDVMSMHFSEADFASYRLQGGDILLNEGQSLELVGRAAIFNDEIKDACFTNTLIRFRSYDVLEPAFALIVFRHYLHSGRFQEIAKITTNLAHLGASRLAALEFPLPPIEEQREISRLCQKHLLAIGEIQRIGDQILSQIDQIRHVILQKGFSGKLTSQNSLDEDASTLLRDIASMQELVGTAESVSSSNRAPKQTRPPKMKAPTSVLKTLQEAATPLSSQALFELSGYPPDAPTELVEQFFLELRLLIELKRVEVQIAGDEQRFLLSQGTEQ
jgi:type I restriction enzyme, S subunit